MKCCIPGSVNGMYDPVPVPLPVHARMCGNMTVRLHLCHQVQRPNGTNQTSYFTPSLVEICAKAIADDFPNQRSLDEMDPDLQHLVISRLSTTLPIHVTVPRVHAEPYWRSCCEARWNIGQLADAKDTSKDEVVPLYQRLSTIEVSW